MDNTHADKLYSFSADLSQVAGSIGLSTGNIRIPNTATASFTRHTNTHIDSTYKVTTLCVTLEYVANKSRN